WPRLRTQPNPHFARQTWIFRYEEALRRVATDRPNNYITANPLGQRPSRLPAFGMVHRSAAPKRSLSSPGWFAYDPGATRKFVQTSITIAGSHRAEHQRFAPDPRQQ